jgi:prephenate dehydrogenase
MDMGSTKGRILESVRGHARRNQFVACHPMAGTEHSGPAAAQEGLFSNRFVVICDPEDSSPPAVEMVEGLFGTLGMHTVYYPAEAHDMHAAFVSHISHVSSFALALTVLDQEHSEKNIFQLAAGGFTSTVRLAKSSAHTWVPIFMQNKVHVLSVLQAHMEKLEAFKQALENDDPGALHQLIEQANQIKRIIS